jgi:outer membrane lipoprotein SlyB
MKECSAMPQAHPKPRPARLLVMALLAAFCGCTKAAAPVAPQAASTIKSGVVVSVRDASPGGDVRGSILGAVGAAPPAARDALAEIIVRDDAGQAVSVMQANADSLRPGDRVVLTGGARTRVTRSGL